MDGTHGRERLRRKPGLGYGVEADLGGINEQLRQRVPTDWEAL